MYTKPTVLGPRVLLKRVEPRRETTGGIVLPDAAVEQLNQGAVCAIGDDCTAAVRVGHLVAYSPFGAIPVQHGDEHYLLLHQDDLLLILN